jgi:hypothetical protein
VLVHCVVRLRFAAVWHPMFVVLLVVECHLKRMKSSLVGIAGE